VTEDWFRAAAALEGLIERQLKTADVALAPARSHWATQRDHSRPAMLNVENALPTAANH
jgi:hypothetical protein